MTQTNDKHIDSLIERCIEAGGVNYMEDDDFLPEFELPTRPSKPFLDLRNRPTPDQLREYANKLEKYEEDYKEYKILESKWSNRKYEIRRAIENHIFTCEFPSKFVNKFPKTAKHIMAVSSDCHITSIQSELTKWLEMIDVLMTELE